MECMWLYEKISEIFESRSGESPLAQDFIEGHQLFTPVYVIGIAEMCTLKH